MAVVAAEARKAGRPLPPWQLFESIRERARERERERERERVRVRVRVRGSTKGETRSQTPPKQNLTESYLFSRP